MSPMIRLRQQALRVATERKNRTRLITGPPRDSIEAGPVITWVGGWRSQALRSGTTTRCCAAKALKPNQTRTPVSAKMAMVNHKSQRFILLPSTSDASLCRRIISDRKWLLAPCIVCSATSSSSEQCASGLGFSLSTLRTLVLVGDYLALQFMKQTVRYLNGAAVSSETLLNIGAVFPSCCFELTRD